MQAAFRQDATCQVACRVTLTDKQEKAFKSKIDDEYRVNMYVCMVYVGGMFWF